MKFIVYAVLLTVCMSSSLATFNVQSVPQEKKHETYSYDEQDQLFIQDTKLFFDKVRERIEQKLGEFANTVHKMLEGLEGYSKQHSAEFYDNLSQSVITFDRQITSVLYQSLSDYYGQVRARGGTVDPRNLTSEQRIVTNGLLSMTRGAVTQARTLALELTAKARTQDFTNHMFDALKKYEDDQAAQQAEYNKLLDRNERSLGKSSWQNLVRTGSELLSDFVANTKQTVKKTLTFSVTSVIQEKTGIDIDAIGDSVKKTMSDVAERLKTSSLSQLIDKVTPGLTSVRNYLKNKYPIPNSQKNQFVQVKRDRALCVQEQTFLRNRTAYVRQSLQQEFGINKPLRVAFCCSGGGNRAMIGTLGILKAAAQHKFLDITTYLTGLSGSTWMIAPWSYMYLQGTLSANYGQSLAEFEAMLTQVLNYECTIGMNNKCLPEGLKGAQAESLREEIVKRFAYQQRVSGVDLYGAMIGNFALQRVGNNRLDVTWSSLDSLAQTGQIPLPLCSSVFDLKTTRVVKSGYRTEYEWFESGPFEAGSSVLGYIPIWALGSEFKNGILTEYNPEYPLSFYLGLYGSAFAVSLNDIIDKAIPKDTVIVRGENVTIPVDTWLRVLLDKIDRDIRSDRSDYIHAQFPNYAAGVASSALQKEALGMFDGGMYFNLPLPLLFDRPERHVDVVIMYDSNHADVDTLVDASRYFKRKGIAMPNMEQVTKNELLSKPMTIFNDPRSMNYDASMPTLIYFPTPKQNIFKSPYNINPADYPDVTQSIDTSKPPYTTLNFRYRPNQLKNLADTMQAIFNSQVDSMKEVLQQVANKRA